MTDTVLMYDDVNVSLLPSGAAAYGAYINGLYANESDVRRKFPNAAIIRISVTASDRHGACLDIEKGDATNAQAPGWFKAVEGNTATPRPWLYTSASNVEPLIAVMTAAGIARNRYFIWSAHYTGKSHICSPAACGYAAADGTQWTDKAMGRSLDQSLIHTYMLPGYKVAPASRPAPKKPAPTHPVVNQARGKLNAAIKNNARNKGILAKLRAALAALRGIR